MMGEDTPDRKDNSPHGVSVDFDAGTIDGDVENCGEVRFRVAVRTHIDVTMNYVDPPGSEVAARELEMRKDLVNFAGMIEGGETSGTGSQTPSR